jgi:putative glutamine amidotransferase
MTDVVRGGSMVQDIPSQVGTTVIHRRATKDNPVPRHVISIEKDSLLAKILKTTRAEVNSYHHQAVKRLGKGIRAVARSADNMPECLEIPDRAWTLLPQWHPEKMEDAHRRAIFKAFVEAASAKADSAEAAPQKPTAAAPRRPSP